METQPIDVVGAGFVPGIVGVWGNNSIPAEQREDAPVKPSQDAPDLLSSLPAAQGIPSRNAPAQKAQPSPSPRSVSNGDENI